MISPAPFSQFSHKQSYYGKPLVQGSHPQLFHGEFFKMSCQDLIYLIISLVFFEKIQIIGKILCHLPVLDILADHFPVRPFSQLFIYIQKLGKILPPSGSGKHPSVNTGFHTVKIFSPDIQIRKHRRVDPRLIGIFFPDAEIFPDVDLLYPVQSHHVKVPDRFIVLRRISRSHNDPAGRHLLVSESLALEELEHGGSQSLRNAVDLINKQDPLPDSRSFHFVIHGSDDLAHSILGDRPGLSPVAFLLNERQSYSALPGMVGNSIRHQVNSAFSGCLLHDLSLADPRRSHKQDWSLPYGRDTVISVIIL